MQTHNNNKISNKQKITILVDFDVYFKIKSSGLNMSALINEYLKAYFDEGSPLRSTEEIEEEIKKKEEELLLIKSQFIKSKEDERRNFESKIEKAKAWNQAKRDARVMDFD